LALAGAGTGKTKTLTAAVVHRIAVGRFAAGWVFAVTFTNKAPTEMSSRIRAGSTADRRHPGSGLSTALPRQLRIEPEVRRLAARLRHSRCR
jgi:DNA helicase-2/ATP-dependent DNA helicase PcrA